jgi:hypothetical protein
MEAIRKKEQELAKAVLQENITGKRRDHLDMLLTHYDKTYRDEVIMIIKHKYMVRHTDREEGARDMYSQALEILLMKINDKIDIIINLNFPAYILGVCRNLYLEAIRNSKEIPTGEVKSILTDDFLKEESPYESEEIQAKIENELIDYYEKNQLIDCLKIMYYAFKKDLKNNDIAKELGIKEAESIQAARRVTVIQQNCLKKAWRNIPLLSEIKNKYYLKKRNRHIWLKI